MQITAIRTKRVEPGDKIETILEDLPALQENDIICITSKIISICEGAIVDRNAVSDKGELIYQEAQAVLPPDEKSKYGVYLTIKNNLLLPSAGIDESNGGDIYILYPKDIQKSASDLWQHLRQKYNLKNLGILITDSHTTPMRMGVTGLGIGWCGFQALHDYINTPDCFGRLLRMTKINILDALAASSVFMMGEGNEQTPVAIIKDSPKIVFQDRPPTAEEIAEITIKPEDDLYAPILTVAPWDKIRL